MKITIIIMIIDASFVPFAVLEILLRLKEGKETNL